MSRQSAPGGQKKKILFFGLFIIIFCAFFFLTIGQNDARAGDGTLEMKFQVEIPGLSKSLKIDQSSIGQYISAIFDFATAAAGILAVVVMMFGGFLWLMSGGNQERAANGKAYIASALSGLVLVLFSCTLLNFVNPDLIKLKPIPVYKTGETANCCAANTGPFSGFQIKENGEIKNTCDISKEENNKYEKNGDIKTCQNNEICIIKFNEKTYSCVNSTDIGCCTFKRNSLQKKYPNYTYPQCANTYKMETGGLFSVGSDPKFTLGECTP